jgi:hypothetical protein
LNGQALAVEGIFGYEQVVNGEAFEAEDAKPQIGHNGQDNVIQRNAGVIRVVNSLLYRDGFRVVVDEGGEGVSRVQVRGVRCQVGWVGAFAWGGVWLG